MPNDFEKQVRQKMGELDLVPGEPVWTKIEEQIRKKKERRRVIFWLPLFLLLTGGLAVWLNNGNSDNKEEAQLNVGSAPIFNHINEAGNDNTRPSEHESIAQGNKSKGYTKEVSGSFSFDNNKIAVVAEPLSSPSKTSGTKAGKEERSAQRGDSNFTGKKNDPLENSKGKSPAGETGIRTELVSGEESKPGLNKEAGTKKETNEIIQPAKNDSAVINKPDSVIVAVVKPKQQQKSNWRMAAVGFAGMSGKAEGLSVLNLEKSMADANNANLGGIGSSPVSPSTANSNISTPIKNSFSFSLGLAAVKQLSEKFRFSAGLEYDYLSNKMRVGGDSAGYIRAYYSAYLMSPGGTDYNYTTHYHFISLPVDIAFAPSNKLPLDISAGISLQQLVGTNGLVYKNQYRSFVNDKESFSKTQLFSHVGVNYSVDISQRKLVFGPQLNYGLSKLLKNNTDTHLFSFGIRTAFVF